uniref:Uncharacterized protein n=1 Tax=Poecilia mexicana TaxID=48701 RepID=A0A3B3Y3K2_9TELE
MASSVNQTSIPPLTTNGKRKFLVGVLATAISVSLLLTLLAKCQVVRRYLASYRHTRLREPDTVSHSDSSGWFLNTNLIENSSELKNIASTSS